jgi:hypothetical protein
MTIKKNNRSQAGPGSQKTSTTKQLVAWVSPDSSKTLHVETAGPNLLHRNLHEARRIRTGAQYKAQRNYPGLYAFAGRHVWHESLFEKSALMSLDYLGGIRTIASQPMMMQFADRTVHYPDFFAVHSDGSQVVYDVRPEELLDEETAVVFAKTKRVCDLVGWRYELFTTIDPLVQSNLEWIAGYSDPRYAPAPDIAQQVLIATINPMRFRDIVEFIDSVIPARGAMTIYNLLWNHLLDFDMTQQLNTYTYLTSAALSGKDNN